MLIGCTASTPPPTALLPVLPQTKSTTPLTIAAHIGVDSLGYLSIEGLRSVVPYDGTQHCQACFNADYPVVVDDSFGKGMFE